MREELHFYYSNDLHSHFENWSNIVAFMESKKRKHQLDKEEYWIFDLGDHVDRFHPIAEAYRGKANVKLLNQAGYDVVTIGNNEGITLEYEDLFHLYDEAEFQITCGNLLSMNGHQPEWLKQNIGLETASGIRIQVIGLTAPFNAFYQPLGWHVETPVPYLEKLVEKLKTEADIIVLLSHLGITEDEVIAKRFPEIDCIIGAHTHHLFKNGEYIEGTLLTAAGKHGKYVGQVDLIWDHHEGQLINKQAYAVSTEHMKSHKMTDQTLESLGEKADKQLGKPVAYLLKPYNVNWFQHTPIIEHLAHYLKNWTKADIGMLNAGILLDDIKAGEVTYGDVHRICPHPINPCTVTLRGIEIIEVVRGAYSEKLINLELKGFGFRGKVLGKFVFDGIDVELHVDKEGNEHVKQVYYRDKPIEHERQYVLATADMFTFGNMFPEIARSTNKQFFLPEFMRDLIVGFLHDMNL
ncbi:bifunctional UDP-sugar hydrolase/5'-nucleotidase [Gracilibacillus sp. YIM 98692]|uniref:bifunctional metallophosphatase/5'-nucleotidase n=1 Tax=Gracilibacillus sp. YIM 98692 TaxID=2663532 RepID=UPI0013D40965|nr:bifunctional UDP-sugar hydrolase/5'-nucleotidase [Gracilibacillus sp. YIM 98692]